jgi:prepilin-type N-terminal cleavage/methylation domain-containing protein
MRHERGFSLVELIVAMTVTLIVSSAIYGLLTSGGNAFRREPELADRQQNIRAAMDLIARDVFGAGAAMPTFAQVFSLNDPTGGACAASLNSCGQQGTMGAVAAAARGGVGGDDEDTDVLQILSTDEQCPNLTVCSGAAAAGTARTFVVRETVPQCLGVPGLVMLVNSPAAPNNASFAIQAVSATGGTEVCSPSAPTAPNGNLTLKVSPPSFAVGGFAGSSEGSVFLYRARLVRYRVAPNPDPLDPTPSLWRTETGLFQPNGDPAPEPGAANSPWQLVARGIEDMQLEYRDGNGNWANQPPVSKAPSAPAAPDPPHWATLVRQVRITLAARASAANLVGESTAGAAPNAVRGQLSTVVAPRAALGELQMGSQIQ